MTSPTFNLHSRLTSARRPRRVMQVITPSHFSGAEMQLVRLSRRMSARGHSLSTIIKRGSPATAEMRRMGLEVDALPIGGKLNVAALGVLAKYARRVNADVVQSTLSTASWWCGWLERFGGPPSIGHVQGFTSAWWHRHQTHLLAVSQAVKDDLVQQGLEPGRITVMHNALSPEEFRPTRDPVAVRGDLGASADSPVVGTFAHLSEKKGYRELFDAIPAIVRELPRAQFWIVGQGGLRDELETTARQRGFINNVRFLGFRHYIAYLMNAIDVLALPSHREPCALVYIEAALLGKPIVACRSGGASESVADGDTGLLVPVGNAPAISEAVLSLLTNGDHSRRMGRTGYSRARDLFGWDRFTRTLEGVYDQVLDGETLLRKAA